MIGKLAGQVINVGHSDELTLHSPDPHLYGAYTGQGTNVGHA
jgi:hypothetical protein